MSEERAYRVFPGWWVVAGAFGVLFIVFGCAYSFPAFFDVLAAEFKGSRGDVSLVFAISGFLLFVVGAVSGPMSDRMDPRWLIGAGVVFVVIGVVGASLATALWQVQIAIGIGVGLGVGLAYVPSVGPVQRWFVRRRGFASGLAVAGIGVGTFAMPIIATGIMETWDWRVAYQSIGAAGLLLGVAATLLIVASPGKIGLGPDGAPVPAAQPGDAPPAPRLDGFTVREAMTTRPFLILWISSFVLSFPLFMPFVHLVPFSMDLGYSKEAAVLTASLIGLGSIAGRFLMGGLADRFGRRHSLFGMYVGLTAMFALWAAADSIWLLAPFSLIFGICYGGYVALIPAVAVDYLGVRHASGILGALYTSVALGTLFGPPLAGYVFDYTKSYEIPLIAGIGFTAAATLIMLFMTDPEKWRAAYEARRAAATP